MAEKKFDLQAYAATARKMVAEGCVLLRNEGGMLPLAKGATVAVFGRSQFNYYKSGTGSGGLVNTDPVPGITDALLDGGAVTVEESLLARYQEWLKDHPFDVGQGWAAEPWYQEEMEIDPALAREIAGKADCAIVILGRTAGEDKDNSGDAGSWLLTEKELQILENVCAAFQQVAVVLNTGNIIDMSWVEKYGPAAVLYVWQGGQTGGLGAADVLTGAAYPSGKLSDTIACSLEDYPAFETFGSESRNIYGEDIYVGYRYFETFAPDRVLYPFGFGLGYTSFGVSDCRVERDPGRGIAVSAQVTNTGSRPGKEVLQAYVEAPQGKLGQPARRLVGFAKTEELGPGESQRISFVCREDDLASYDDSGVTGHKNAWVLEGGEYRFYVGTDVRSAQCAAVFSLEERAVEQLSEALAPVMAFDRLRPGEKQGDRYEKIWEPAPQQTVSPVGKRRANLPESRPCTGDKGYKLGDVQDGKVSMEEFLDQLSDEDLFCIVRGEGMCSPKVTAGTAGAFGGVTQRLLDFGIPTGCCADGPSGIRMDCGTKAFAMPNGTLMACSFNPALAGELYEYEGLELRKNKVDTLLGPGINLHRHPLNGRNFEYFSEDPLLTGVMAASQLLAMQKYGVTGTIKHFFCNSQEFHRHDVEAVASQRALRELYLKGFEIAVKQGKARSIMTSYNPVNGWWSASNYDLLTVILRGEWGFTGQVMTDWWAKGNDEGKLGERTNMASLIRGQNDLYMVTASSQDNTNNDNSAQALAEGTVTRGEYLRSAANICGFLLQSPALLRLRGMETELDKELEKAPSFDGENDSPMFLAEADDDNRISLDVSKIVLEKGKSTRFSVVPKEGGRYVMKLTLRSIDDNDVSQLPLSVFQERNLLQTITLNGSQREWQTVEMSVVSMSTLYLRFFAGQTGGLEIKSCELELVQTMAELMAAFQQMQEKKEEE